MTPNPLIPLDEALRAIHETATPSVELEARVSALAMGRQRRPPRRALRTALALGAVGIAAAAGIAFLSPRRALAETVRRASRNLLQAHELHYRTTAYAFNGKPVVVTEGWWKRDGRLRTEIAAGGRQTITIQKEGKSYLYDPSRAAAACTPGQDLMSPPVVTLDPVANASQAAAPATEDLGIELRHGRRLQKAAVSGLVQALPWEPAKPGRTVVWLDVDRLLPVALETQTQRDGRWSPALRMELEFDAAIADGTFRLPPGVRVYDQQALGVEVGKRFEHSLARQSTGEHIYTVRDVQLNRDGDVFILYTDGSSPKQLRENEGELTDDHGTRYTPKTGGFTPWMGASDGSWWRGISTAGEPVQGFCFVPVEPSHPAARPRRLRLTIRPVLPEGRAAEARAQFTLAAPAPGSGLLPTYAPSLADLYVAGNGDPVEFKLDREQARRVYFNNQQNPSGVIRCSDRALRQGVADVTTYLDRAAAFEELGRFAETRAAIERARELDELGSHAVVIRNAELSLQAAIRHREDARFRIRLPALPGRTPRAGNGG